MEVGRQVGTQSNSMPGRQSAIPSVSPPAGPDTRQLRALPCPHCCLPATGQHPLPPTLSQSCPFQQHTAAHLKASMAWYVFQLSTACVSVSGSTITSWLVSSNKVKPCLMLTNL